MKRRRLLTLFAGGVTSATGCLQTGPSPDEQSPTATTPPQRWCDQAFTPRDTETDDCTGTRFAYVVTESISDATTEPGETPYEGTFDDYLEVQITTASNDPLELRGCIKGMYRNSEKSLPVATLLSAERSEYTLTFGPFTHPGGISEYHLWIANCDAEVQGSI